ncbi:MAG: hypothetical protein P8186_14570 [Anaerolineae bacterium]
MGQQVSVKAANTLAGRLVKAYGQPLQTAGDDEPVYSLRRFSPYTPRSWE